MMLMELCHCIVKMEFDKNILVEKDLQESTNLAYCNEEQMETVVTAQNRKDLDQRHKALDKRPVVASLDRGTLVHTQACPHYYMFHDLERHNLLDAAFSRELDTQEGLPQFVHTVHQ